MNKLAKKQIITFLFIGLLGLSFTSYAAKYEITTPQSFSLKQDPWNMGRNLPFYTNTNELAYKYLAEAMRFLKQKDMPNMLTAIKKAKQSFLSGISERQNIVSYNGLIKIALYEKNYQEANDWLHKSLLLNSNNTETLYLQAKLLMAQHHYPEARILLEKIVKNNDKTKLAFIALAELEIKNKEYPLAEAHYKHILTLDKKTSDAYINLAVLYQTQDKNKAAFKVLMDGYNVFQHNPVKAIYFATALTKLYVKHNKLEKGLQLSQSVFERFPNSISALNLYVDTLLVNHKVSQAELLLTKKIKQNRKNVELRLKLISLLSKDLANKPKIMQLYREISILTKGKPLEYIALARYHIKNKEYTEAEKIISDVKNKFPETNVADILAGEVAISRGIMPLAAKSYLTAYKKNKNNNLLVKVTQVLISAKQQDQAIKLLNSELKNKNTTAGMLLASIYMSNKNLNKAERVYRTLLQINPENYIALNDLAWLLSQRGKHEEALSLAKKAYIIAPNSTEIIDTYANILKSLGLDKKAAKLTVY